MYQIILDPNSINVSIMENPLYSVIGEIFISLTGGDYYEIYADFISNYPQHQINDSKTRRLQLNAETAIRYHGKSFQTNHDNYTVFINGFVGSVYTLPDQSSVNDIDFYLESTIYTNMKLDKNSSDVKIKLEPFK